MTLRLGADQVAEAARLLREGELVAFPTETVYGLGADARNGRAVAAVFEAISTEVNRPDLWCGFPPPPAAEEALHDLRGLRRELERQQEHAKVNFPLWWEPELMGLVHAWAKGVSWNDLIANTSLDEGDVVRIMRRTVDLLAQVPYCEAISQRLRDNARAALKAINRFPVCEPIDLLAGGAGLNPATERTTTASPSA